MNEIGFKLLRLQLKGHPVFADFDINFYDQNDSTPDKEPYTSLLIGPNGTGKSNLLKIIIQLFNQIHIYKTSGKCAFTF